MKKITLLLLGLALCANLAACGGSKEPPTAAPATTAAPTTAAPTTIAPEADEPETDAEEVAEAVDSEEVEYTLDYDSIASWVTCGYIGNDESGSPVVMGLDDAGENAIIIFGDNSDMTAASFVGEITYEGDLATITDVANDLALTFGVKQVSDDTIELDMGDIGSATIKAAAPEEVLDTIKTAIDNYRHVA